MIFFKNIFNPIFIFKKLILKLLQCRSHFRQRVSFKPQIELSLFYQTKTDLRIHTVVEKEGIVRHVPLKGGSLEITCTVPLSLIGFDFTYFLLRTEDQVKPVSVFLLNYRSQLRVTPPLLFQISVYSLMTRNGFL